MILKMLNLRNMMLKFKTKLIEDNRDNIINNKINNDDDFKLNINDILTNENNIKGSNIFPIISIRAKIMIIAIEERKIIIKIKI